MYFLFFGRPFSAQQGSSKKKELPCSTRFIDGRLLQAHWRSALFKRKRGQALRSRAAGGLDQNTRIPFEINVTSKNLLLIQCIRPYSCHRHCVLQSHFAQYLFVLSQIL